MTRGEKKKFVLGIGARVPAAEVVQRAKAAGIKLSEGYVYVLRSQARGRLPQKVAAPLKSKAFAPDSASHALVTSALEFGLVRAQELLGELRTRMAMARQ